MEGGFDLKLVSFLSDSRSRSGEDIASELGCSRTAVWKHVTALRAQGIEIDAIAGQGYRLKEPLELLEKGKVLSELGDQTKQLLSKLVILPGIDSTNSWIQSRPSNDQHGVAVLAESQSAGRGRRGQNWVSPFGRNIYASIGWTFDRGVGDLACLPLMVALASCEALDSIGLEGHLIKWPNDILIEGRKLGGCLVEIQGDINGPCQAVLGVGLNVRMPASAPGALSIDQPWTDVYSRVPDVSRNRLAGALLDSVFSRVSQLASDGLSAFHDEWKRRDGLLGREVVLSHAESNIRGIALGISDRGGLMVQSENGVREYLAGEVNMSNVEPAA